jgi:sulfur carrier protein
MKIVVNGEALEAQSHTLAGLLAELGYEEGWYATALNCEVVTRQQRASTSLADGDRIEILTPRQGG